MRMSKASAMHRKAVEHPKDLEHGDKVTIEDTHGNQLTGLLEHKMADDQLEVTLSMRAFGKEIRVASWKAGAGRHGNGLWTSYYPVVNKELTLW